MRLTLTNSKVGVVTVAIKVLLLASLMAVLNGVIVVMIILWVT